MSQLMLFISKQFTCFAGILCNQMSEDQERENVGPVKITDAFIFQFEIFQQIGHVRDESFQSVPCTGTHKQTQNNPEKYTRNRNKEKQPGPLLENTQNALSNKQTDPSSAVRTAWMSVHKTMVDSIAQGNDLPSSFTRLRFARDLRRFTNVL